MHSKTTAKIILVAVFIAVALAACSTVPSDYELAGEFQKIRCVDSVPMSVRTAMFGGDSDNPPKVVDDRLIHPFRHDSGSGLPPIVLLYAIRSGDYWIVVSRTGSFARWEQLEVARVSGDVVEAVWSFMGRPNGQPIDEFLGRLESKDACFVSPPRHHYYEGESERCSKASASN